MRLKVDIKGSVILSSIYNLDKDDIEAMGIEGVREMINEDIISFIEELQLLDLCTFELVEER